jgi:4-carboxymuconolactone decarboxylase
MKFLAATVAALTLMVSSATRAEGTKILGDVRMVAPALEKYTQGALLGDVWKRPGLSARDRSIVTIAALIARNQTIEMPFYFNLALDSGVKPREISEIITHLAFYSGWANAMSAVAAAKNVFSERNIGGDQLPAASPSLLPIDEAAEAQRATRVEQQFGAVAPGVVQYTTDICSVICGCALILRRATAASPRSAHSSLPARSRSFPLTSAGRWITD